MSAGWLALSLLGPPLAAAIAGVTLRSVRVPAPLVIALNGLLPGAGLAALRRPLLETVLCTMFGQASLLATRGPEDAWLLVPLVLVGALWASLHTPLSPIAIAAARSSRERDAAPAGDSPAAAPRSDAPPTSRPAGGSVEAGVEEPGYSVALRCTECGAVVDVPVLSRMAHCSFCGSDHLVVGHDEILQLAVPAKVRDAAGVREAVLDHYRYQHYLKLYRSSVAPLEQSTVETTQSGTLITRPEGAAAVAAAEAAVSKKADLYRARLASEIAVIRAQPFLAPYRHGMGTLYQAAFGRRPADQEKSLQFAISLVEASTAATTAAKLPPMGRLSYLRTLAPAAHSPEEIPSLRLDVGADALETAYGDLDRKRLVRDLDVIRLGVRFTEEIQAVVWRPWWIAEVRAPGVSETLLVDAAAASVAGPAPHLEPGALAPLPGDARAQGAGLRFVPMECPTCGHEYRFDTDAVLHFCNNCHRVFAIAGSQQREVQYLHSPMSNAATGEASDLVPFWYFALHIRTADGELISDLAHLKDGIDGTLDQIGEDAEMRQHGILVPAFRCINSRLAAEAYQRLLLHTLRRPPSMGGRRFPLDQQPRPWSVSLEETDARAMLPLYLARVFSHRDLARVKVHQAASWLLDATQEKPGALAYIPIPRRVTEPFRAYVGRYRPPAERRARDEQTEPRDR